MAHAIIELPDAHHFSSSRASTRLPNGRCIALSALTIETRAPKTAHRNGVGCPRAPMPRVSRAQPRLQGERLPEEAHARTLRTRSIPRGSSLNNEEYPFPGGTECGFYARCMLRVSQNGTRVARSARRWRRSLETRFTMGAFRLDSGETRAATVTSHVGVYRRAAAPSPAVSPLALKGGSKLLRPSSPAELRGQNYPHPSHSAASHRPRRRPRIPSARCRRRDGSRQRRSIRRRPSR
jgi:hypothetical protein